MAIKYPVLIPSCTLTTAGTIRVNISGPSTADLTIPAGRYWHYPADQTIQASDSIDAIGRFSYLWDQADAASLTATAEPFGVSIQGVSGVHYVNRVETSLGVLAGNAATTTAGRTFLSYMGWDKFQDLATSYAQSLRPVWTVRPEAGDVDEKSEGFGAVVRLGGGAVYTGDLGDPLMRRTVSFESVPGGFVNARQGFADETGQEYSDQSFESLVWRWASRGELVRYYADRGATNNYLDAAMTNTASTCTLASGTGFTDGTSVCIDGEWMGIRNVAGAVLTVTRHNPVAHPKYAPVSTDFVGTYALAMDGGNVNARTFNPSRRAPNQDRWDMEIALVRASWS